jgi:two-component system nitrate/nitrite response regulator NarL
MPSEQLSVLVADEQPPYRDSVVRVVRQSVLLSLAAECGDGREALAAIERLRPDVAVLSATLPSLSASRVLTAVARDRRPIRVVLIGDAAHAYDSIALGAVACLSREARLDEVADAIAAAARGGSYFGADVQTRLAYELRVRRERSGPVLTDREREVLRLVADGQSVPGIAGTLHLAPATVKTHLAHVYEKLGVGERAAAVAHAMRHGLLE